jgi:NitT/TauT family transport system permease protein
VILIYDQLMFRPIVAWADKFRFEQTAAQQRPRSWVFDLVRRARLIKRVFAPLTELGAGLRTRIIALQRKASASPGRPMPPALGKAADAAWLATVVVGTSAVLWFVVRYLRANLGMADVAEAVGLGFLTLTRVAVLIALASLIWVPIGVWLGLRPWAATRAQPIAQFLAAFPANVLFPIVVVAIVSLRLDPNIWLSPLMVLGTQWYILFNVVAGASAFPTDLREASTIYRLRSRQWWSKVILPGIFPYYVTGALTASGGSWNASIVAEVASWGDTRLEAAGLGAFIAKATDAGDYPRVVLGVAVMSVFVVTINRLLWGRLYALAARRYRIDL